MRSSPLVCRLVMLGLLGLPVAPPLLAPRPAHASENQPRGLVVQIDPSVRLDSQKIRQAIAEELGVTVLEAPPGSGPPSGTLVIHQTAVDTLSVVYVDPQGHATIRVVRVDEHPPRAVAVIALLVGNLVRVQVGQPAPPPSASSPALAASPALPPPPAPPAAPQPEAPRPEASHGPARATEPGPASSSLRTWGWVGLGTGAGLLSMGLTFHLLANAHYSSARDLCVDSLCNASGVEERDQARAYATRATIAYGAGLLTAGVGLALLVWPTPSPQKATAQTRPAVWVGPGSIGLAGAF